MKPSDHPEFFRLPAPEGRSRESTLKLDALGRFWHDGLLVTHPGLAGGLHRWIGRHPDDRRFILSNGYDWTYFTVEDAPYFVRSLRVEPERVLLLLSDATEEPFDPTAVRLGPDQALYTLVKRSSPGGPFEAKLTPHAQTLLEPMLVACEEGRIGIRIGSRVVVVGSA